MHPERLARDVARQGEAQNPAVVVARVALEEGRRLQHLIGPGVFSLAAVDQQGSVVEFVHQGDGPDDARIRGHGDRNLVLLPVQADIEPGLGDQGQGAEGLLAGGAYPGAGRQARRIERLAGPGDQGAFLVFRQA